MTDEKKNSNYSPFQAFAGYEQGKNTLNHRGDNEGYGSYLFGSAYDMPDGPKQANWSSYTSSRVMIRMFSRGIMGATLYTWANHAIPRQLRGYDPDMADLGKISEFPLRYVAKFFDTAYGKPIEAYVKMIAPADKAERMAEDAIWFRRKNDYNNPFGRKGRSIGAEVTAMSFDFAMGSVGDATGRYIVTCVDPNVDKDWMKDGHFDAKVFAQETAKEAWKIFSKNQGEDWAAALPYIYQMKYQRQALNNLYPGFKYTSDLQLNGGSWRVDREGHIVDSYAKAGALDLQARFSLYNWYTLMYRDAYDAVAEKFNHMMHGDKEPDLKAVTGPADPLHSVLDTGGQGIRYAAKSLIKSMIYMTPAVPFFWATRVPQTKYKGVGIYIDPNNRSEGGIVQMPNGASFSFKDSSPNFHTPDGHRMRSGDPVVLNGRTLWGSELGAGFDPFDRAHTRGVLDTALTPWGESCYKTSEVLYKGLRSVGIADRTNQVVNRQFVHDWTNASISYTPYMIAKAETAIRWDRPLMDKAIYRFIDGISGLNLAETKAGLADIREQIMHPPTNRTVEEVQKQEKIREEREIREELGLNEQKPAKPDTQVEDVSHQRTLRQSGTKHAQNAESDVSWQDHFKHETSAPQGVTIH